MSNSKVVPLAPFLKLNANYGIDSIADAEDLHNDATCFLESICALADVMTNRHGVDPNIYTIEMLARMALNSLNQSSQAFEKAAGDEK